MQQLEGSGLGFLAVFSSDDRTSGTTDDFSIRFNPSLDLTQGDRYTASVQSVNTWYSHYNVSDDYQNRTIAYYNGSIWRTITLDPGNYSAADWINEFEQLVTVSGDTASNIAFSANQNTQRFEVVLSNNYRLDFSVGLLYVLLGVNPIIYTASFVAPNVAKMSNNVNAWVIHCSLIDNSILGANSSKAIYTLVPAVKPGGNIREVAQYSIPNLIMNQKKFTDCRIHITDQLGRRINLNSEPFSISMFFQRCYIKK